MPHQEDVKAVIINMNPGLSETTGFGPLCGTSSDETQFYKNIDDKCRGWLIREFRDAVRRKYSKFVGINSEVNWSCLNPALLDAKKFPQWVCGVNWWQGYARCQWFGDSIYSEGRQVRPSEGKPGAVRTGDVRRMH